MFDETEKGYDMARKKKPAPLRQAVPSVPANLGKQVDLEEVIEMLSNDASVRVQTMPAGPGRSPDPAGRSVASERLSQSLMIPVVEVAQLLNVSRSTVDRMAERGEIPGRMKLGGQVRYHRPTLEAWLEKSQRAFLLYLLEHLPESTDRQTVQGFRIDLRRELAKGEGID